MPIGEFGGARRRAGRRRPYCLSTPLYWLYEMSHAALNPARAWADATRLFFKNPVNPLSHTTFGKIRRRRAANSSSARRAATASRSGSIYSTSVGGERVPVHITPVWERPFCRLLHFERAFEHAAAPAAAEAAHRRADVRPLRRRCCAARSKAFLPNHDVYITEWVDARMVPLAEGRFDLDDYIDY